MSESNPLTGRSHACFGCYGGRHSARHEISLSACTRSHLVEPCVQAAVVFTTFREFRPPILAALSLSAVVVENVHASQLEMPRARPVPTCCEHSERRC